jgi:transposase
MRGFLGEFGVIAPLGAKRFMNELPALLSNRPELPPRVRIAINELWAEVRDIESRIEVVEHELEAYAAEEPVVQALVRIPGIGVLTASALFATIGSIHTFKSGRQLACWLGLTPRESSSGGKRRLGAISKQGDPYLRMLLIHGARSALNAATRSANADKPISQLQAWALERADKAHRNKAVVALANKMARIVWAVWRHERVFDGNHVERLAA